MTGCLGALKDHILDWEDALPEDELERSEEFAQNANLSLCLGTSLQIIPACDIPLETVNTGGRLVIVNLQKTPKDGDADLVIHSKVDKVMRSLLQRLKIEVPNFIRRDKFVFTHRQGLPTGTAPRRQKATFQFEVVSPHGPTCPLPMLKSATIEFPENPDMEPFPLMEQPFRWTKVGGLQRIALQVILEFEDGADEDKRLAVEHFVLEPLFRDQYLKKQDADGESQMVRGERLMIVKEESHTFVTQEVEYDPPPSKRHGNNPGGTRKRMKLGDEGFG